MSELYCCSCNEDFEFDESIVKINKEYKVIRDYFIDGNCGGCCIASGLEYCPYCGQQFPFLERELTKEELKQITDEENERKKQEQLAKEKADREYQEYLNTHTQEEILRDRIKNIKEEIFQMNNFGKFLKY